MKNKKKKKYNPNTIHIFSFFIVLLSISIGYAAVSYDLEVNGTLALQPQKEVVIINVEEYEKSSGTITSEIVRYEGNILTTSIELTQDSTSYITFKVTIKNESTKYYLYRSLTYDNTIPEFYSNPLISPVVLGISPNDKLAPNETKDIYLKFYYNSSDTTNKSLDSIVSFKFDDLSNVSAEYLTYNNTRTGVACSNAQCMIEYLDRLAK